MRPRPPQVCARPYPREWLCRGRQEPPSPGIRGASNHQGEDGWKGQAVLPEALFAHPLQKACWKSELLNARTVRPMTTTSTTTSTKPHPISTAGTAELLRAG